MPQVNRKSGKMDWASYVARRRLNVMAWVEAKGMKTYKDLCEWLDRKGVEAPEKSLVADLFKKPKKVEKPEEKAVEEPEAPKKRSRSKKKTS